MEQHDSARPSGVESTSRRVWGSAEQNAALRPMHSRSLKHSSKASSYFSLNAARKRPIQGVIVRLRGVSRQLALGSRRLARPRSIEKAHMLPAKQV